MSKTQQTVPSQKQRWLKYGFNVAVLVIAVLAIVVIVNWIAYRAVQRAPWLRQDWTATRRYSLSPQTTRLLGTLDKDVRIVTLYAEGSERVERTRSVTDLLAEYERRSGNVTVEQIDPVYDIAEFEAFVSGLLEQYEDETATARKAIDDAMRTLEQVEAFAAEQAPRLQELMAETGPDSDLRQSVLMPLSQQFGTFDRVVESTQQDVDRALDQALPNFSTARQVAQGVVRQIRNQLIDPAVRIFEQRADLDQTPGAVKEFMLAELDRYRAIQEQLGEASRVLDAANTDLYSEVRRKIAQANSMVLRAGEEMTVITLEDVYTVPQVAPEDAEQEPRRRFKGEEVITGAILSLTLEHKPLVVFMNGTPQPAIGMRGQYSNVAQRLQNMNFEVTEWNPMGRQGRMGQRMPPEPLPEPEAGQPMVLVALPVPPPSPQQPLNPATQQIQQALAEQLEAGRPALVFLAASPMMGMGQGDPILDMLGEYGISVNAGKIIMTTVVGPGGREQAINRVDLERWPDDEDAHPIPQALSGLRGVLLQASPMQLSESPEQGMQAWPLIVTPEQAWAEDMFQMRDPSKDEDDPEGPFNAAAAVETDETRLVAISDPVFATDGVINYGYLGQGTAELTGAVFPANAEWFVNSVYWLAGLDEMIASSPRTQDVRRIGSMTRASLVAVWWIVLALVPLLCLTAGGVVWFIRRR